MKSPKATAAARASKRANRLAAFDSRLVSGISMSGIRNLRLRASRISGFSMQQCKHRGNKNERRHRGAKQAAHHRAAERGVLLASITQTKSHRDHADDHGEGRHENWPKPRKAGFDGGLERVAVALEALRGKCH